MAIAIPRITGRQVQGVVAALFLGGGSWLMGSAGLAPSALADDGQYGGFYIPPDVLSGQPGDVIRDEPSRIVLEPSGQIDGWRASGTRIMYDSSP